MEGCWRLLGCGSAAGMWAVHRQLLPSPHPNRKPAMDANAATSHSMAPGSPGAAALAACRTGGGGGGWLAALEFQAWAGLPAAGAR